jgi:hypothetical protein
MGSHITNHQTSTNTTQTGSNKQQSKNESLKRTHSKTLLFENTNNPKRTNKENRTQRVHILLTANPAPTRPKQGRTNNNQKTNLTNALTPQLFFLKNTNNNKKSNENSRTQRVHILLTTNLINELFPKFFFWKNANTSKKLI